MHRNTIIRTRKPLPQSYRFVRKVFQYSAFTATIPLAFMLIAADDVLSSDKMGESVIEEATQRTDQIIPMILSCYEDSLLEDGIGCKNVTKRIHNSPLGYLARVSARFTQRHRMIIRRALSEVAP